MLVAVGGAAQQGLGADRAQCLAPLGTAPGSTSPSRSAGRAASTVVGVGHSGQGEPRGTPAPAAPAKAASSPPFACAPAASVTPAAGLAKDAAAPTTAKAKPVASVDATMITVGHWGRLGDGELFARSRYVEGAVLKMALHGLSTGLARTTRFLAGSMRVRGYRS